MEERARDALKTDRVVDITTTGRKSGRPRRIEIWAHSLDGQVVITGSPGRRSWYANLVADPDFIFHLKGEVRADLPATARAVIDEAERWAVLSKIKGMSQFAQRRTMDVEQWVKGGCLVEVTFRE